MYGWFQTIGLYVRIKASMVRQVGYVRSRHAVAACKTCSCCRPHGGCSRPCSSLTTSIDLCVGLLGPMDQCSAQESQPQAQPCGLAEIWSSGSHVSQVSVRLSRHPDALPGHCLQLLFALLFPQVSAHGALLTTPAHPGIDRSPIGTSAVGGAEQQRLRQHASLDAVCREVTRDRQGAEGQARTTTCVRQVEQVCGAGSWQTELNDG